MKKIVRFSQSARKHKIGRAHALYVMNLCDFQVDPEDFNRRSWVGVDSRGRELEITGIDLGDYFLVIHVMPTRRVKTMAKKESKKLIYTSGSSINLDQEKVLYKGKRLTEARAAKLGEETAKKFRGRPSLSNKKEESPIVQFRVTKAKKIAIKKKAKAEKISESELLRRAVDLVLASK